MNVGAGKWSTVWAALLSAVALLSAAPASADPTDDAFVAALVKHGIVIHDRNNAIAMAHAACDAFDESENSNRLAMRVMNETDLSLKQSGYFVGVSVAAYCPQYKGHTDDSLNWLNPGTVPQM
jgi:hypothetical protein